MHFPRGFLPSASFPSLHFSPRFLLLPLLLKSTPNIHYSIEVNTWEKKLNTAYEDAIVRFSLMFLFYLCRLRGILSFPPRLSFYSNPPFSLSWLFFSIGSSCCSPLSWMSVSMNRPDSNGTLIHESIPFSRRAQETRYTELPQSHQWPSLSFFATGVLATTMASSYQLCFDPVEAKKYLIFSHFPDLPIWIWGKLREIRFGRTPPISSSCSILDLCISCVVPAAVHSRPPNLWQFVFFRSFPPCPPSNPVRERLKFACFHFLELW